MNLANNLSVLRVVLAPAFVGCLVYYGPGRETLLNIAIGIFIFACITDALDGYFARKFGQVTVFGSYIDPLADKLLLVSGFLSLSLMTNLPLAIRIPAWVTIPVVTRDLVILTGSTVIYVVTGKFKAEPLLVSKMTTLCQMIALFAALVAAPPAAQLCLYIATVVLTVASGFLYVRMGGELIKS